MNTEKFAAKVLLEKGIGIGVKPSLFFRMLGITLKCYAPTMGIRIRISEILLEMDIDPSVIIDVSLMDAEKLLVELSFDLARIVAYTMVKGRIKSKLLNPILAKWLLWNMTFEELMAVVKLVVFHTGTVDFLSTTRLVMGMRITAPKLGQNQGS